MSNLYFTLLWFLTGTYPRHGYNGTVYVFARKLQAGVFTSQTDVLAHVRLFKRPVSSKFK